MPPHASRLFCIGIRSIALEELAQGTTIDLMDDQDTRIVLSVLHPEARVVGFMETFRMGPGKRRLTINPSDRSYVAPGTRMQRTSLMIPGRNGGEGIKHPDGPLTVGVRAAFVHLDGSMFYAIRPLARILLIE